MTDINTALLIQEMQKEIDRLKFFEVQLFNILINSDYKKFLKFSEDDTEKAVVKEIGKLKDLNNKTIVQQDIIKKYIDVLNKWLKSDDVENAKNIANNVLYNILKETNAYKELLDVYDAIIKKYNE